MPVLKQDAFQQRASAYLREITQDSVQPNHIYVLVPTQSCVGCKKGMVDILEILKTKDSTDVIFSAKVAEFFPALQVSQPHIKLDMDNRMDRTNFDEGNIIMIRTNQTGKVNYIKGYKPKEMSELYNIITK